MLIGKTLAEIEFDSVEKFVSFCEAQAQTQKGLLYKNQVAWMVQLAGSPKYWPRPQEFIQSTTKFHSFHEEMDDLVARYRLIKGRLDKANSYDELFQVATMILGTTHQPVSMVSGPVSTGGTGNLQNNILAMSEYITHLHNAGENMFDQTPFEEPIQRIKNKKVEYDNDILYQLYLPIFESGYIKKMFFMRDWESSRGARWEHEQMIRLKIERKYQ